MRSPKQYRITKNGREFIESIDHRTDSTKLWRTIKGIDGKSKQTAENEGITFTGRPHTSPKMIANSFNCQFTTSKLGKHSSSRRIRQVSKDVKRMFLEEAEELKKRLPRLTRRTLAELRTNKSHFLKSYLHKVDAKAHPSPLCNTHTHSLVNCTHIRTTLSPLDLWTDPGVVMKR